MTITCPSCEASYRISPETLGGGRKVRCARCRTQWFASPEPEPELIAPGAPEVELDPIPSLEDAHFIDAVDSVEAERQRAAPDAGQAEAAVGARRWFAPRSRLPSTAAPRRARRPSRRIILKVRPVAVAAALGVAACGIVVGERVALVRAAPSLASLYAAVGLPVNVRGLSIDELKSVEEIEEGVPLLLVTGVVRNDSREAVDVPRLRLAVTGGGDRELYAWTTVAARAKLAPGESAAFRARLASPPADGRGIAVRFLARRDLVASAAR
ncbi:zinc-ribbon domain-containing protein [Hansschlegelia zhihuaiae]|uniref:DUF3426 domain-containing protein n=1 Tax=Hansschlegelia zhihuaiae TaxID=405005 RepID=A0A4Q0MCC3_9HYPH|nr:zinc-ribbon domain-containing protein [Hansschlegelia zhihuaiae]RXF70845.1 DUF3426 domain-containing protein [Hansschlegelia zhihuaiae]